MRKWVVGSLIVTAVVILALLLNPSSLLRGRIQVRPPALQSSPLSLEGYESSLLVPVSVTATRLGEMLDELVPRSFRDSPRINIGGPVRRERLDVRVNRSSIAVRADENRIRITTRLSGRVTVRADLCFVVCAGVSESADLAATARVTLTNVRLDSSWAVQMDRPDVNINVTRAEVRLIADQVPISFRREVQAAINRQIPDLTDELGGLLDEIDLVSMLEAPWRAMHHTVRLSEDPEAWLAVQPRSLGVSPVTASDDVVTVPVALSASMAINVGDRPVIDRQPFPAEPTQEDGAPAFRLRVPVVAEFDELASVLNACCGPVAVPLAGDSSLTFSNLTLAEHQGGLLLGADFATSGWGAQRGTVYVLGTPALEANTLRLDDLEFTVESSSVLAAVAAGVARGAILDNLHDALRIDMTPYYAEAAAAIESAAARLDVGSGVDLEIEVGDVALVGAQAGDAMLAVVGEVEGAATVRIAAP